MTLTDIDIAVNDKVLLKGPKNTQAVLATVERIGFAQIAGKCVYCVWLTFVSTKETVCATIHDFVDIYQGHATDD